MSQDLWTAVDGYLTGALVTPDRVLDAAVKSSAEAKRLHVNWDIAPISSPAA